MLDWKKILTQHGIEFIESGPSTAKGNLYTACPFCKETSGYHMGISLFGKGWGCWKRADHRGRSPRRLLAGLLGVGIAQAQALLDGLSGAGLAADYDMTRRVKDMRSGDDDEVTPYEEEPLEFPPEIRPLTPQGQGHLFTEYLEERGWLPADAARVAFRYKLRYAMRGAFAYRLVVPVYGECGLLTWTGRTIAPDIEPRYKTLSTDPEKAKEDDVPVARENVRDCLFGEADLFTKMGAGLVVCEGPMDAIRVDYAGHRLGFRATCLFGKALSDAQVEKLAEVAPYYGRKLILLDSDATMDAYRLLERLAPYGYSVARLPRRYKDPGEMPLTAIENFLERQL